VRRRWEERTNRRWRLAVEHPRCHIHGVVIAWRTGGFINGNLPQSIRGVALKDAVDRRVVDMMVPPFESDVASCAGVPVRCPARWGQHGFADDCIGLQTVPTHYWRPVCPKKIPDPKIAIRIDVGCAGGCSKKVPEKYLVFEPLSRSCHVNRCRWCLGKQH
jgi:hypothetical protein